MLAMLSVAALLATIPDDHSQDPHCSVVFILYILYAKIVWLSKCTRHCHRL